MENKMLQATSVTCETVAAYCEKHKLAENVLLTAAFGLTLGKYANAEEIIFALAEKKDGAKVLRPVQQQLGKECGDMPNPDYVKELAQKLAIEHVEKLHSIAEVQEAYSEATDVVFACDGVSISPEAVGANLAVTVEKEQASLVIRCDYQPSAYQPAYVEALLNSYETAIKSLMNTECFRQISILSEAQEQQLEEFNATEHEIPIDISLPENLARIVAQYPDRIAVAAGGKRITYAELGDRVNHIADALYSMGVRANMPVALLLNRTIDVYPVRQGILASGGAFIAIDPAYPDDRISYIMEDAKATLLITTKDIYQEKKALLDGLEGRKILFVEELYHFDGEARPEISIAPDQLAYCLYTSGSTGRPKGCMLTHQGIINFVHSMKNIYPKDVTSMLALASISFDVSALEEFVGICQGKTIAMATEEEIRNPLLLGKMMEDNKVDWLTTTPSYIQTLINIPELHDVLTRLKCLDIGAEPFPVGLYSNMRKAGITGMILNTYGPTETTIGMTADILSNDYVSIGKPIWNTKMWMVDFFDNLLPVYAQGELIIAGTYCIGKGYIGMPEQTAEKFIPFRGLPAYRSGDIALWTAEGKVECKGRKDNQVKLRGLRIELDEIENVINTYEGITRSVVLVKGEGNNQFLCAYYMGEKEVSEQDLQEFIGKKLTEYMVPHVYMYMDSIPMNTNGKVDKKALPEPVHKKQEYEAPRTETEKKVFAIAEKLMEHEEFGVTTDLFFAGLSSLLTIMFTVELEREFDVPLSIREIKENNTVEKLAAFLEADHEVQSFEVQEEYPLRIEQQFVFGECIEEGDDSPYNSPNLLKLHPSVDLTKLKEAVVETVNAHPYLLTRLRLKDEETPVLVRNPQAVFTIDEIGEENYESEQEIHEKIVQPFALIDSSLLRVKILHVGQDNYIFLDVHHIIFDGMSANIFFEDVTKCYLGETLQPEKYSGYEASLVQQAQRDSEAFEKAKAYNQKLFTDKSLYEMPKGDKEEQELQNACLPYTFKSVTIDRIKAYCQKNRLTENTLFTAAFGLTLGKYRKADDVAFVIVYDGRNDSRFVRSTDMFSTYIPVVQHTAGDWKKQGTTAYLKDLAAQMEGSMANTLYTVLDLMIDYEMEEYFTFSYQGDDFEIKSFCGQPCQFIDLDSEIEDKTAIFNNTVFATGGRIRIVCDYLANRYSHDFVEGFLQSYEETLAQLIEQ